MSEMLNMQNTILLG